MQLSASKNSCKLYLLVTVCLWHTNSSAAEAACSVNPASHPDGMTKTELQALIAGGERNLRKILSLVETRTSRRAVIFESLLRDSSLGPEALEGYQDHVKAEVLLKFGIPPLFKVVGQRSVLGYAKMQWLIDYGADIEGVASYHLVKPELAAYTPLCSAIALDDKPAIKILLAAGAKVNGAVLENLSCGLNSLIAPTPMMDQRARGFLDLYCVSVSKNDVFKMIEDEKVVRSRLYGERGAWFKATLSLAIDAAEPVRPVMAEDLE